ncbi:hypothetical protein E2542_SST08095 [Spatholobus suberectus]|nr:hypothetical protein E2542_SST08095 [Spatholobus suberectus]
MGEVNVQTQNEPMIANSPRPTPTTPPSHKHNHPIIPNSPPSPMCDQILQNQEQHIDHASAVDPTDLFSLMHLTNGCCHRQPPCSAANNPMKRRSPPQSSSSSGEPSAKKLFCDQEDLTLYGFSAVHVPLNLNPLVNKSRSLPVLRRCVSDPYRPPAPARGPGLPPLPPSFRRSVSEITSASELTPSPDKALSREETTTPDSVRLRKMKERFKEMRQWWDDVMKDEEEDGGEECAVAEDDKVLAQDDLGEGDSEEAVSVEWAERCLSLVFRCPCGKGYEVELVIVAFLGLLDAPELTYTVEELVDGSLLQEVNEEIKVRFHILHKQFDMLELHFHLERQRRIEGYDELYILIHGHCKC